MRSNSHPSGKAKLSFIEEARRKQIVDTAIVIIATRSDSQASLSEIAREAGCSKGVISYHFEGKEELVEEILSRLLREPAEFIKHRVDAEKTALDKVGAYVEANFEYMQTHRNQYVALVDLWGSRGWSEGRNRFDADAYGPSRSYLSRILELGEESGELREIPGSTMASVIQAAIDGVMLQWVFDQEALDLHKCKSEILEMISAHVASRELDGSARGQGKTMAQRQENRHERSEETTTQR
jgi:AcrR family transcriptional regulator